MCGFQRGVVLTAPRFENERLVGVNKVAKKLGIFCCAVTLVGVFVVSRAFAGPPDLSGVWLPDIRDQKRQKTAQAPPWNPEILPQIHPIAPHDKRQRTFLCL